MTAAITESARGSFSGDIIASIRANGIVAIPPGQLWERVAEGKPTDALKSRRLTDARVDLYLTRSAHDHGPRLCNAPVNYRERHVCPVHASNGIIRAGERVK